MDRKKLSAVQKIGVGYYRAKLNFMNAISHRWAAKTALDLFSKPYRVPKKPDPAIWATANSLRFQTETGILAGFEWRSPKPSGKKLLVLHGFAGSSRAFEAYITAALQKGYDVYAYDAPAHGKSEGTHLNAANYANIIDQLIKEHGFFDAYLAHSLGGLSLMLTLHQLHYQQKPKIVLIAPATESKSVAESFYEFMQLPARVRVAFEERVKQLTGVPLQWYSIGRILHDVKANILWLHDEDDTTTPIKDVYPLMQQNPLHVHFYFTKGLGHSRIYKDAKVQKRIVDFL